MAHHSEHHFPDLRRRGLLRLTGLVTVGGLAGCTGGRDGNGTGDGGGAGGGYGGGGAPPGQSPTDAPVTDTLAEGVGDTSGSETADPGAETELPPETTLAGSPTPTASPPGSPTEAMTETPVSATVALKGVEFDPVRLEVPTGVTVTWVNEDSFGHDVTATEFHDVATSWDLEATLGPDDSVSHTFEDAGIYEYVCTIHGRATMCGVVLVGDETLQPSLPCESDGESY